MRDITTIGAQEPRVVWGSVAVLGTLKRDRQALWVHPTEGKTATK